MEPNQNPENITPRQIVYVVLGLAALVIIFFIIKSGRALKSSDPAVPSQIDQQIFNKLKSK